MARGGIEPPTRGFSVLCSTDWAIWPRHRFWRVIKPIVKGCVKGNFCFLYLELKIYVLLLSCNVASVGCYRAFGYFSKMGGSHKGGLLRPPNFICEWWMLLAACTYYNLFKSLLTGAGIPTACDFCRSYQICSVLSVYFRDWTSTKTGRISRW